MDSRQSGEGSVSNGAANFPLVSALFITYNRLDLLESAVNAFWEQTDYPNLQVVIADDGSPAAVRAGIQKLRADRKVTPEKNKGLGANINQGMAACDGEYILMVQDDWVCRGPANYLREAVQLMESHAEIGLVNFAGIMQVYDESEPLDGVSEPAYLYLAARTDGRHDYLYSDQPHMRRRSVNELIGPYLEDKAMENCERDYEQRWAAQTRFRTAVFPGYYLKAFTNEGLERSFRETSFRNRLDRALMPVARRLQSSPVLFNAAKSLVRMGQGAVERVVGRNRK